MPRVALALLLTLVVLPFSAGAAGHDVSAVRQAPSGYGENGVAVAFNGNRILTVWSAGGHAFSTITDAANGESSTPFVLPGITGGEEPAIVPWGDGFLTLWKTWDYFQIVKLTASGVIEQVSRVSIAWRYQSWKMASNGRQFLVVDEESLLDDTCYSSLYEPDGTLLARTTLPIRHVTNFAVARDGDSFVVVTGGYDGVHFFRIDDTGSIVAERELQVPRPGVLTLRTPYVAVTGLAAHAMVAWTDTESTGAYATTVSSSNEVAALQPLPIKNAYPAIRAVPSTSGSLIVWSENEQVFGLRTSAAGQLIDSKPVPLASGMLNDATAAGDQFGLLTLPPDSASSVSLVLGAVRPQGVSTFLTTPVTLTAARQEQPVIASDGVDYVAAWLEHDGLDVIAKAGRVTRFGAPLDGTGVTLPVPTKKVRSVSIARGAGGDALVVVAGAEETWAFRWSRIAGLVDQSPIILDRGGPNYGTAVAWNGVSYLVVRASFYTSSSLAGWFVDSNGSAGAKFDIPMTLDNRELAGAINPAIAWDGRQFLISVPTAYNGLCNTLCPSPYAYEIRLVRLSAAGSLLDKTPYRVLNAVSARVATSGSEFLLLSQDDYHQTFSAVVVHTAPTGLSVSARVMTIIDGGPFDVTWDGAYYDVPWFGGGGWLHVWRLDRSGNVVQKLFTGVSASYAPSVTANDSGEVALGIAEEAPPAGVSRARIYFGSEFDSVQPVLTAPTNAVSHLSGSYAAVTWEGNAPGFLVEQFSLPSNWIVLQRLPGEVHQTTVYTKVGDVIRIRAIGPDGSSPDGAITTIHSDPRTRTVRR
jgi:hypothetical protein